MAKNIKIAFVTASNPKDKKSWSGIHYKMYESLLNKVEKVDCLGPIPLFFIKLSAIFNKITRVFFSKGYNHKNSILISFIHSKYIQFKLKGKSFDYIFAPAASTEIAFLKTNIPIIYCSDSSFGQLNNYYDTYSNLFVFSVNESNYIEQKAILKASYLIYSSKWASNFVEANYKTNCKPETVAFGANISDIRNVFKAKTINKLEEIQLLFLGVDWYRKGGEIVYETFLKLLEAGYNINLKVCGCVPPVKHSKIEVIPFLDKNKQKDLDEFTKLLENSHLLFLPTKADCTPIVFCESSLFGTPTITRDTGGVSEVVYNEINGFCLDENAKSEDYFNVIRKLIENESDYEKLSLSSRRLYEDKLNWDKWANEVLKLVT
jgi:glycosyltransferase involved in cell wall biosynthesis